MEALIKMVTEKAGISEDQAKTAVNAVISFLKDKMPAGIGSQVETFVKGGNGNLAGNIKDKISDKVNKWY